MTYNVGDLVAEFLAGAGVTTAFGIVSIHNIPILDAIGRRKAIRFVPARGEMGAGPWPTRMPASPAGSAS